MIPKRTHYRVCGRLSIGKLIVVVAKKYQSLGTEAIQQHDKLFRQFRDQPFVHNSATGTDEKSACKIFDNGINGEIQTVPYPVNKQWKDNWLKKCAIKLWYRGNGKCELGGDKNETIVWVQNSIHKSYTHNQNLPFWESDWQ